MRRQKKGCFGWFGGGPQFSVVLLPFEPEDSKTFKNTQKNIFYLCVLPLCRCSKKISEEILTFWYAASKTTSFFLSLLT